MCASSSEPRRRRVPPCRRRVFRAGFTLVELTVILIMLGILAAVALPRLSGGSEFRALEFRDRTAAALRHAQKSASSHRRRVCVAFTASTLTLSIALANPAATCAAPLMLPGSGSNVVASGDAAAASYSPLPAAFDFFPDGSGADRSISITNAATPVTVVGATGHVQ